MQYDVFISHASEDKEGFVRELAEALAAQRLQVWYDEFSLTVGDSVRRSIDHGLTQSRFGVVVLSPSFFAKRWTEWELDGLVGRHVQGGGNLILPVWHELGHSEVSAHSPSLANLMAIPSTLGVEEVVKKLMRAIRPEGSVLEIAREVAMSHGLDVPAVTDDYWLEVAQWAGSTDDEPWSFLLPSETNTSQERGTRLGWAAMQKNWMAKAQNARIHALMAPAVILSFINGQPGMMDTCMAHPRRLRRHSPLFAVPGLGGPFEQIFNNIRTVDNKYYELDVLVNLLVMPYKFQAVKIHHIDCLIWSLSSSSEFLPDSFKDKFIRALTFHVRGVCLDTVKDLAKVVKAASRKTAAYDKVGIVHLTEHDLIVVDVLILRTKEKMGLAEDVSTLAERLKRSRVLEEWVMVSTRIIY